MTVLVAKSQTPSVTKRPIVPSGQWDLLPSGKRVAGVNILMSQTATTGGEVANSWADCWTSWPWDTWIKPQIDAAAAYGFNTVRLFGTVTARYAASGYTPQLDDQTYLNRWRQVLDYIRQKGMYAYPTLGGCDSGACRSDMYAYTPSNAWFVAEFTTLLGLLATHADVIFGIDILNESDAIGNWAAANGVTVYAALKAVASQFSYTLSCIQVRFPPSGSFDHLDAHFYIDGLAADYFDADLVGIGCPILIGEWGTDYGAGSTARQARANMFLAIVNYTASGRRVAGAQVWDLIGGWGDGDWGVLNADWSTRSDVLAILQSFPTS